MQECWQNIQTCRHKYVVIAVREEPGDYPKQPSEADEPSGETVVIGKAPPCKALIKILCIFPPLGIYLLFSLPRGFR